MPWQLRYVGQTELGDESRPTIVWSSVDIGTSSSVVDFMTEIAYRLDFEYIMRGYVFWKGRMIVTVSKIFQVSQGKVHEGVEPISQRYLVELDVSQVVKMLSEKILDFLGTIKTIGSTGNVRLQ